MKNTENRLLKSIAIIALLICMGYCAPYLKNPYFQDNTCQISSPSKEQCVRTVLPDGSWSAVNVGVNPSVPTTFSVVNAQSYRSTAPEMHAILMSPKEGQNPEYKCLTQTIPKLPPGKYNFTYTIFSNSYFLPFPSLMQTFLMVQDKRVMYINFWDYYIPIDSEVDQTGTLQTQYFYSNAKLMICSYNSFFYPESYRYVRNVTLNKLNDTCDPLVASSQKMIDGTYGCVPHDVVMKGVYCDQFAKTVFKKVETYECGYCDPFGTTPNLVFISGTYKGCVQTKVPGAVGYQFSQNTTDSSYKKILLPICDKTYNTRAKLAIPNHQLNLQYKDQSSSPCRDDFGAVTIWNAVNGKYVAAECAINFILVNLINSTQVKACVDPRQLYYDQQCLLYTYNSASQSFLCKTCASSFTLAPTKVIGLTEVFYDCLPGQQVIQYCSMYTVDTTVTPNIYRCAADSCSKGKIPSQDFMKCGDLIRNCRYLDSLDQSKCSECIDPYILINGQCTCLPSKLRNDKC